MIAEPSPRPDPSGPAPASSLAATVAVPHEQALAALDGDRPSLPAVAWCASHLAATYQVVHPAALRVEPDGPEHVRRLRSADAALQQSLWRLDRRLTGDATVQHESVAEVESDTRACLAAHMEAEQAVVADLERALSEQELQSLAEELQSAMAHAPTRPHPDTPHSRLADRLVFRVDALIDRLRDLMDNRHIPDLHRMPTPRPPGKWGSYALGTPLQPPEDDQVSRPAPR